MNQHPDDLFHPPKDDDPFWTETSWYTFSVPERNLSGQLYPFFRINQGVAACAVFIWDHTGDQFHTARYARQTWHLPIPDMELSDIALPNGLSYRCVEPLSRYAVRYSDPDGEDVHVDLDFSALTAPHHTGHGHLDQPCHVRGELVLDGDRIEVDAPGFRDRSWGRRGGFGRNIIKRGGQYAGYSFATADVDHGFHALSFDKGTGDCSVVHGHYRAEGVWSPLVAGTRRVVSRDPRNGNPLEVRVDAVDELGRELHAHGRCRNAFSLLLNPNIWCINCLTEWTFGGVEAWGEDHENWTPYAYRRFFRDFLAGRSPRGAGLLDAAVER